MRSIPVEKNPSPNHHPHHKTNPAFLLHKYMQLEIAACKHTLTAIERVVHSASSSDFYVRLTIFATHVITTLILSYHSITQ